MDGRYNMRSPAVKRLMKEAQELSEPTEQYFAQPLEDNLFEWHFTIRGPSDSEFESGIYHGRIILPPEYPMKPPSIMMLTPNGRFEIFKKICLSISGHHPESWQPSWSIRTALLAIIGFMPTHGSGAIGSLDYTADERKVLAKKTQEWKCTVCGRINNVLKPVTEASEKTKQEARDLAAQINFQGEKEKKDESNPNESGASSGEMKETVSVPDEASATAPQAPVAPPAFPWPMPSGMPPFPTNPYNRPPFQFPFPPPPFMPRNPITCAPPFFMMPFPQPPTVMSNPIRMCQMPPWVQRPLMGETHTTASGDNKPVMSSHTQVPTETTQPVANPTTQASSQTSVTTSSSVTATAQSSTQATPGTASNQTSASSATPTTTEGLRQRTTQASNSPQVTNAQPEASVVAQQTPPVLAGGVATALIAVLGVMIFILLLRRLWMSGFIKL